LAAPGAAAALARAARPAGRPAAREAGKVIMVLTLGGKVIMRLPSTGGKVIKVIT